MTKLQDLFMPVEKVKVQDVMPGYLSPKGKSHFIIVDTPKGKRIANMCSEDYGLIPNKELLVPFLENLEGQGLKFQTQVKHIDHTKFFVDLIFDKATFNMGTSKVPDIVQAKIRWANSYDLSLRYGLSAGIWRQVCSNGMMAPDEDSYQVMKKIHTTNFSEISLSETVSMVQEFLDKSDAIIEPFEILKERKFAQDDLEEFLDDVIEFTKFPKRQKELVLQRIIEEKVLTNELTGWQVYNGFNFQLNHNEEITLPMQKRQKLDRELIDFISYS